MVSSHDATSPCDLLQGLVAGTSPIVCADLNTRSILARFGDNNWEKGEDFVKTFYVKKLVWEMEGSLSARALVEV